MVRSGGGSGVIGGGDGCWWRVIGVAGEAEGSCCACGVALAVGLVGGVRGGCGRRSVGGGVAGGRAACGGVVGMIVNWEGAGASGADESPKSSVNTFRTEQSRATSACGW